MNPLENYQTIITHLVQTHGRHPVTLPDGLVLSYDHRFNCLMAARHHKFPYPGEITELVGAIRRLARVAAVVTGVRLDHRDDYYTIELMWAKKKAAGDDQVRRPSLGRMSEQNARSEIPPSIAQKKPAEAQAVYQAIYWNRGEPVSLGLHTDRRHAEHFGRSYRTPDGRPVRWSIIEYSVQEVPISPTTSK